MHFFFLIPKLKLKDPCFAEGNCCWDSDESKTFTKESTSSQQASLDNTLGGGLKEDFRDSQGKRDLRKATNLQNADLAYASLWKHSRWNCLPLI